MPGERSWIIYGSFKEDLICVWYFNLLLNGFLFPIQCFRLLVVKRPVHDLGIEYNMLSMVVLKGQRILNVMSIFSELVSNCHNLFVSWRKSNHK